MLSSTNVVILKGRVGKDPEMRFLNNGTAVCSFSMATEEKWVKGGEEKKQTDWHRVVAFGDIAERAGEMLRRGSAVGVCGKLRQRSYDNKEGRKVYVTEVIAETVMTTGEVAAKGAGGAGSDSARGAGSASGSAEEPRYEPDGEDSIPF